MKEFILNNWPYVIGGYETISRLIPTQGKNLSLIHKILNIAGKVLNGVKIVSDFLNREKPYTGVKVLIPFIFVVAFTSCKSVEKVTCASTRQLPVTFINTTTGATYTANVPFCDTVYVTQKPVKQ